MRLDDIIAGWARRRWKRIYLGCGQIDIGNALTDVSARLRKGVLQADETVKTEAMMDVRDIANSVAYMASLPLKANAQFMTAMASAMPLVGRG